LRWGPMCHLQGCELNPETVRTMAEALHQEYVVNRGLYLEILPNAFSGSERAEVFQSGFTGFDSGVGLSTERYRTFVLDLSPTIEELRKKLDSKWRNKLSGAEKNGLRLVEGDTIEAYGVFRRMYAEMWARKKFRTTVNVDEFGRIQERLAGNQRMRVLICLHGEEPVAGIVCSALGESAIYLLGATSDNGLKLKGAHLLQWEMIRRLRDNGVRYYDLGGIDPEENPGVYSFKSGLCGVDVSNDSSFSACDNPLSAGLVKAGKILRGSFQGLQARTRSSAAGKSEGMNERRSNDSR
jgi:lipid II:glycine glycyltransferase (peptidoglycan interpeptide bridge formation enzyme)